ncbi:MAG TPA: hypothetical protein LFV92_04685 [Rickettsia endosymbiont of Ceroptres masudai]|nr:hypothetical protein [Rickettsia endosymbiont of Ceroptres masudai]
MACFMSFPSSIVAWISMSFLRKQESKKNRLIIDKINLKKQVFCRFYWIPAFAGMT